MRNGGNIVLAGETKFHRALTQKQPSGFTRDNVKLAVKVYTSRNTGERMDQVFIATAAGWTVRDANPQRV